MNDHPRPQDFESFLQAAASPEVGVEVVRHLLAACRSCRAQLEAMGWGRERLERLVSLIDADPEETLGRGEPDVSYDEAFAGAWRACLREMDGPRGREPRPQLEELELALDDLPADVEDLVPETRLVELFVQRSHAARYQDARLMLRWARLARLMAERCSTEKAGSGTLLADLRARAWGQLGNALRVTGRLREAERALGVAEAYAAAGTADPMLRVDLFCLRASLYTSQRQFDPAVALLVEAEAICHREGALGALPQCLLRRALATVYSGDPELAIQLLDQAIPLIDARDHHLLFAAYHNLIYCYIEAGRLQEGLALVAQTRNLSGGVRDDLLGVRVIWLEGRILCELGLLEEAEAQFCRARDSFTERDLGYDAALVALELTAVYVKLGLHVEVRRTIADILPIFSSLRVARELLASLVQLQQSEDQTQTLQLIRALSRELIAGPKLPPSL